MKILFIGSYPNPVEPYRSVFYRELIYEMADQGVDCTVISCVSITSYKSRIRTIPEYIEEYTPKGNIVRVFRPHIVTYSAKKIGNWNTIHATQKSVERAALRVVARLGETFDAVYGHFFVCSGMVGAKIARKMGIPAYIAYGECSFETEVEAKYGKIKPEEMDGVKGIIAVSSANKKDIENRDFAKGIPVLLSLNSINPQIFHVKDKACCRQKFGMPDGEFIVGFVGYFIERKGYDRVLEACRDISDVKLAFAGKGTNKPTGKTVVFCDSLAHDDIPNFLNAVDAFVLPTRHEGCCNAVIEAMACGKAIISSDLPFNHDILNHENAILVDPDSIEQIREGIISLRDSDSLRKSLGEQVLQDVQVLTISRRAEKILEFIEKTNKV